MLRAVADILRATCRDQDTVYRLGGEEFVALFPGATVDAASRIAERMRRKVETQAHVATGRPEPITVSIGIAHLHARVTGGYKAVIDAADAAMRGAKTSGRNRVTLAQPGPDAD